MSKAFTRESDDAPEPPARPRLFSPLPPGAKNYLTVDGARRLQTELDNLLRAPASELVSARIQQLTQSLETAVVVVPPEQPWEQVRFGATVTVRNRQREDTRYRLVGVDETDIDRDWISWCSPLARVLLNARVGQCVRFKFPMGEEEREIVRIEYE